MDCFREGARTCQHDLSNLMPCRTVQQQAEMLTSHAAKTARASSRTILKGVASCNDVLNSTDGSMDGARRALDADLHWFDLLVDLNVDSEGLLKQLDSLATLANDTPHHVLGAVHNLLHTSSILHSNNETSS